MNKKDIKNRFKQLLVLVLFVLFSFVLKAQSIRPYAKNTNFWEFHGKPVLLIGGSSNDNLFQNSNLNEELHVIQACGGNYVRCSLSGRNVGDVWPFWRQAMRFNLNKFNPDFWKKLDDFFKLTAQRKIFVQVEIWAIHDFMECWEQNPWNPERNNVFTEGNTHLKSKNFADNQSRKHNFFYSVPQLNNDSLLLSYQKMFVDQFLSVSLKYEHILYCVTNEIYEQYSPEWGWFWANYLKQRASEVGKQIQITEMYQNPDVMHEQHQASHQHPEIYSYVDISQNSRFVGEEHWRQLQKVRKALAENPRPVNHIKTFGGPQGNWTSGPEHGIARFWRNIVGGAASTRFNRPPSGIGISDRAQAHIKSARMVANEYDFFTSEPDVQFLFMDDREIDEAYLASNAKKDVVVYFPDGGKIIVDSGSFTGKYKLKWLNLEAANWCNESVVEADGKMELKAPYAGGWIALLTKM